MPGGYLWWYVDGISSDGRYAVTIIVFIGSVFSPYYYWSDYRDAHNHCAVNVALYGSGPGCWAMTERGGKHVTQQPTRLTIGPSDLDFRGDEVIITIDELAAPIPRRLRGQVRLKTAHVGTTAFALDPSGLHRWTPLAAVAEITVDFEQPALRWQGTGYLDSNEGDEPLARAFQSWNWSRAHHSGGTTVLYDTVLANGRSEGLAIDIDPSGAITPAVLMPDVGLPATPVWRIQRGTRADAGAQARVIRTIEDTPFYSRSIIATRLQDRPMVAMHESLSMQRFNLPIVKAMLPVRMPRRWR